LAVEEERKQKRLEQQLARQAEQAAQEEAQRLEAAKKAEQRQRDKEARMVRRGTGLVPIATDSAMLTNKHLSLRFIIIKAAEAEEEAKRQAELEARALAEAKRRAEEEAAEAQRQADVKRRKEEAEARRLAEEAAEAEAEAEAKRQAEARARAEKAAQEEAQAEAARRKAEEEKQAAEAAAEAEAKNKAEADEAEAKALAKAEAEALAAASAAAAEQEEEEAKRKAADENAVITAAAEAEAKRLAEEAEAAERMKREAEAQAQAQAEAEAKAQAQAEAEAAIAAAAAAEEAKQKAEAEAEAQAQAQAEAEAAIAAAAAAEEAKQKAEAEAKAQAQAEAEAAIAAAAAAEEAKQKAEAEAAAAEEEAKRKAEAEAKVEAEAKAQAAEEAKRKAEAEAAEEAKRKEAEAQAAIADAAAKQAQQKAEEEEKDKATAAAAAATTEEAKEAGVNVTAAAAPPAGSKKLAFMAQLNAKLGAPPGGMMKASPAPPRIDVATDDAGNTGESPSPSPSPVVVTGADDTGKLQHLTLRRVKAPKNHRISRASIRLRPGQLDTASATGPEASITTPAATEQEQEQEPVVPVTKKLPAGIPKGPAGAMSMGGLINQLKKGGGAAGLRKTSDAPSPNQQGGKKLIKIHGKKPIAVWSVAPSVQSLSHTAVYILDDPTNSKLWLFSGSSCSKMEKTKALDVASRINRNEHGGRFAVEQIALDSAPQLFWSALEADAPPTKLPDTTGSEPSSILYQFTTESTEATTLGDGTSFDRALLSSNLCYLLDCPQGEAYFWSGQHSPKELREAAFIKAQQIFSTAASSRPSWGILTRVAEKGEPVVFLEHFTGNPPPAGAPKPTPPGSPSPAAAGTTTAANNQIDESSATSDNTATHESFSFDVSRMWTVERPARADIQFPDDGTSGQTQIWQVDGFGKSPIVAPEQLGVFDSTKCYIVLYQWGRQGGGERFVIYCWLGRSASPSDKGSCASLAMEVNSQICKGAATTVSAIQFREPIHLQMVLRGELVINDDSLNMSDGTRVYHVKETPIVGGGAAANTTTSRAVQVASRSDMFHTLDCFIIARASNVYLWVGAKASESLAAIARNIANRLRGKRQLNDLKEGQETKNFWKSVGNGSVGSIMSESYPSAKLFWVHVGPSGLTCDRLWNDPLIAASLHQDDFASDRIMLLDIGSEVFLWIGADASRGHVREVKFALQTAVTYASQKPAPNPTPQYIFQGFEPLSFSSSFHPWLPRDPTALVAPSLPGSGPISPLLEEYSKTYPLSVLMDKSQIPPTVDVSRLEEYLNPSEYSTAFKMTKEAFFALPEWKRTELKKSAGFY
jgi:hypothetical protein